MPLPQAESPKVVSDDIGILETVYGNRWLAMGDAAMTYDSIASHGLTMGMVRARDAAGAIHAASNGVEGALEKYGRRMFESYKVYSESLTRFYPAVR